MMPLEWRLYVITGDCVSDPVACLRKAEAALAGGADVLQYRDKHATDDAFRDLAEKLLKVARRFHKPLIVNDRLRIAAEIGADGLHLGQDDAALSEARRLLGPSALIGRSTHSEEQAEAAQREGFDYIGVGPVFGTPTKPAYKPVGLDLVRFAAQNIQIPFVAIGGIDATNIETVRDAGAKTVAVVRAVTEQEDPESAARHLKQIMERQVR